MAAWSIALTIVLPLLGITLALLLVSDRVSGSGGEFTSIYQGSIRFNSYVGLAAVSQLYGDPGMTIAAVTMAIMIPIINVLCVTIFVVKTGVGGGTVRATATEIATNPLIIACLSGVALNLTGIGLPLWFGSVFHLLSLPALPLGLLAVGAGLKLDTLHSEAHALVLSSSVKFAVAPLAAFGAGLLAGLEGDIASGRCSFLLPAHCDVGVHTSPSARRKRPVDGDTYHGADAACYGDTTNDVPS